jgi:PAS domain S-box-containing protein
LTSGIITLHFLHLVIETALHLTGRIAAFPSVPKRKAFQVAEERILIRMYKMKMAPCAATLRTAAEAALENGVRAQAGSVEETLYELQVHQVELEMQNEALRQKQIEVEEARKRYQDLFEFAPVGYLTLTTDRMIAEINLTACRLLGVDRKHLLRRQFASLVIADDQDRWAQLFLERNAKENGSIELSIRRADGAALHAHVDYSMVAGEMRLAMSDVTALRKAERESRLFLQRIARLTGREREVLHYVMSGIPNAEVAARLEVSLRTVEGHRGRILLRTGTRSFLELSQLAARAGCLLSDTEPGAVLS